MSSTEQNAVMRKRRPDLYLIGAAKSGTSTLFSVLDSHPEVYFLDGKEIEFFSNPAVFSKGYDWYTDHFTDAPDGCIAADGSTGYSRWPHTLDSAKLISEFTPGAKLIYLMRHPVDRAYSHYLHHMRQGVTMSFEEAMAQNSIYLDCSRYMMQINRYLRFFSPDRMLFLQFCDLKERPEKITRCLSEFLEIDHSPWNNIKQFPVVNAGGDDHYLRTQTTERLYRLPLLRSIVHCIPSGIRTKAWTWFRKSGRGSKLRSEWSPKPIGSETRKALISEFRPLNTELFNFLGYEIPDWNI